MNPGTVFTLRGNFYQYLRNNGSKSDVRNIITENCTWVWTNIMEKEGVIINAPVSAVHEIVTKLSIDPVGETSPEFWKKAMRRIDRFEIFYSVYMPDSAREILKTFDTYFLCDKDSAPFYVCLVSYKKVVEVRENDEMTDYILSETMSYAYGISKTISSAMERAEVMLKPELEVYNE
jgi:hypothetical protein